MYVLIKQIDSDFTSEKVAYYFLWPPPTLFPSTFNACDSDNNNHCLCGGRIPKADEAWSHFPAFPNHVYFL